MNTAQSSILQGCSIKRLKKPRQQNFDTLRILDVNDLIFQAHDTPLAGSRREKAYPNPLLKRRNVLFEWLGKMKKSPMKVGDFSIDKCGRRCTFASTGILIIPHPQQFVNRQFAQTFKLLGSRNCAICTMNNYSRKMNKNSLKNFAKRY